MDDPEVLVTMGFFLGALTIEVGFPVRVDTLVNDLGGIGHNLLPIQANKVFHRGRWPRY